mgnify:CR=1 FL=1
MLEDLTEPLSYLNIKPNSKNAIAFAEKFGEFRNAVNRSIGEIHRNQAKERLDMEDKNPQPQTDSLPAPPPPPALSVAKGPAIGLLSEIHRGINLKSVDRERARSEQSELIDQSVGTLGDLQSILSNALEQRAQALLGDWSDEDDWSSDEEW